MELVFCSNKSTDQLPDLFQFINQVNSIHSFGTNLSQLMFISLPNEKAFEAARMWLPLHIPAWNKECVYACCAATLQLTSPSDSHLLMVAPVSCLWSLFPEEEQVSISGLTLHQPSSTSRTRLLKLSSIAPLPAVALELVLGMV